MTGIKEEIRLTVHRFVDCINEGDPECLITWQTEDFTFIDYDGDKTQGRDGWPAYFHNNPDYTIHGDHMITSGTGVAVLGRTTGSHVAPEVEKKETILWIAEVRNDLISEWRLYSDTKEIEQQLESDIDE